MIPEGMFPYLSSVSLATTDLGDRFDCSFFKLSSFVSSSSSLEDDEDTEPEEELSVLVSLPDPELDAELDEFCSVLLSS